MSLYQLVQSRDAWEGYLEYEQDRDFPDHRVIKIVENILKEEKYKTFDRDYIQKFELPVLMKLSEYNTSKKRIVYVYPEPYRTILKLIGWDILRRYNNKFCKNSLAYTQGRSVRSAFRLLDRFHLKKDEEVYKNDFSDYFNSIDIDLLETEMEDFFNDVDKDLIEFVMVLLREERVQKRGKILHVEQKGVMAGSPIAGILANIFMHKVDQKMYENNYRYIRYADDTLIAGKDALEFFRKEISKIGVVLNPKKMATMTLESGITFLGFKHTVGNIDISDKALAKMKSRMKRRAKWYRKWMIRNNVPKYVAVRDYIRKLNRKLFTTYEDSINWSQWYLPNITTTESIQYLDTYYVICIRYLNSGTWRRGKSFYSLSYKDIKKRGFRSLVNEYYKLRKSTKEEKSVFEAK